MAPRLQRVPGEVSRDEQHFSGGAPWAAVGGVDRQTQLPARVMSRQVFEVGVAGRSIGPPGIIAEKILIDFLPGGIESPGAPPGPFAGMGFGLCELLLGGHGHGRAWTIWREL